MAKPVEFDEMLDVTFAEMYITACMMEKDQKISSDGEGMDDFVRTVKQIAADYVEKWEKENLPDFWSTLYTYAEERLMEIYPMEKKED